MKRFILAILMVCILVLAFINPAGASARWVIAGWSAYETSYITEVDAVLGYNPSWMSENYDLYTRQALSGMAPSSPAWSLMRINYYDYSFLQLDNNVSIMPDFPLDAKVSAMSSECKTMCQGHMTKWNIPDCMTGQEAYRDVIQCIGRQIYPSWNVDDWPY